MVPTKDPQTILTSIFNYRSFRSKQKAIIENVLANRDTLAILPTGAGKSLCFQIPALMFEGLTIVVSPLIALMKDQVEERYSWGGVSQFRATRSNKGANIRIIEAFKAEDTVCCAGDVCG